MEPSQNHLPQECTVCFEAKLQYIGHHTNGSIFVRQAENLAESDNLAHLVCMGCLDRWREQNPNILCPTCRTPLSGVNALLPAPVRIPARRVRPAAPVAAEAPTYPIQVCVQVFSDLASIISLQARELESHIRESAWGRRLRGL